MRYMCGFLSHVDKVLGLEEVKVLISHVLALNPPVAPQISCVCVSVQVGTWRPAKESKGIYVSWVLLILLVAFTLARTIYWRCLRISDPISNIT